MLTDGAYLRRVLQWLVTDHREAGEAGASKETMRGPNINREMRGANLKRNIRQSQQRDGGANLKRKTRGPNLNTEMGGANSTGCAKGAEGILVESYT